jgi:hypothetical protein
MARECNIQPLSSETPPRREALVGTAEVWAIKAG